MSWRRGSESNRRMRLLQSPALPLGYPAAVPKLSSLLASRKFKFFASGRVKADHVIGVTDEMGEKAVEVAHPLKNIPTTILHLLSRDDNKLTYFQPVVSGN